MSIITLYFTIKLWQLAQSRQINQNVRRREKWKKIFITSSHLRVAKVFPMLSVTRESLKFEALRVMEPKLAAWRGTGHRNMMRDLLFYKRVIYLVDFRDN